MIASMLPEFRCQLAAFKTALATVERVDGSPSISFRCHYEAVNPKVGGALDYETPAGYGYHVYPNEETTPVELNAGDVIAVDGFKLEVQEYQPLGNLSGSRRAWCMKR
jgi:hypothetical protein